MTLPKVDVNGTAADTAEYIAVIAKELRVLAAKADLGFLAYLLAMAEDDAQATARRLAEHPRSPQDTSDTRPPG